MFCWFDYLTFALCEWSFFYITDKIIITIPDEYLDVKEKFTNELKDWITQNYLGCEVK